MTRFILISVLSTVLLGMSGIAQAADEWARGTSLNPREIQTLSDVPPETKTRVIKALRHADAEKKSLLRPCEYAKVRAQSSFFSSLWWNRCVRRVEALPEWQTYAYAEKRMQESLDELSDKTPEEKERYLGKFIPPAVVACCPERAVYLPEDNSPLPQWAQGTGLSERSIDALRDVPPTARMRTLATLTYAERKAAQLFRPCKQFPENTKESDECIQPVVNSPAWKQCRLLERQIYGAIYELRKRTPEEKESRLKGALTNFPRRADEPKQ